MRIETALPVSEVRRRLRQVIQKPRIPIPFLRRPLCGLIGKMDGDSFELRASDWWRGRYRIRGVVAEHETGTEIRLEPGGRIGGRIRMSTPVAAAVVALVVSLVYSAMTVAEGSREGVILMVGLTGFLLAVTIAAAYFATLPVPSGSSLELARLLASVVEGRLELFEIDGRVVRT